MSRKDAILNMRQVLVKRRDALRKALAGDLSLLGELKAQASGDVVDAALDSVQDEISSQLAEVESRELARIEYALERMRGGHYGVCEGCGCSIPMKKRPLKNISKVLLLAGSLAAAAALMLWMRGILPVPDLLAGDSLKTEGRYLMGEGKMDEAVESLRKSADVNSLDDEVYATLCTTYLNMRKNGRETFHGEDTRELAAAAARSAVRVNPLSSAHRLQLARIIAVSDIEKAIDHAREAVRIYPSKPQGHVVLGDLLARAGRKQDAADEYKEALRLNDIVREPWLKIPRDQIDRIR